MLDAVGAVLPAAAGVALSPIPIIAVVLVLGAPRARSSGPAFASGWLLGLSATTALVVLLVEGAEEAAGEGRGVVAVARVTGGIALLVLAGRKWWRRPRRDAGADLPGWMATFGQAEPGRAALLGALLAGANPKNLILTVAASASAATIGLDRRGETLAIVGYVVLASSTVLGAVGAHLLSPARSRVALARVERAVVAHSTVLSVVVLGVLGTKVLADGLRGL